MLLPLIILFGVMSLLAGVVLVYSAYCAPEGYETEAGFYFAESDLPEKIDTRTVKTDLANGLDINAPIESCLAGSGLLDS